MNGEYAFYRGKRLLVTGGSGYLATNLVRALKGTRCDILRLSRSLPQSLQPDGEARVEDMAGDITDEGVWERALEGRDVVFHLAAQTSVYAADENPSADLAANVLPMLFLLETCRRKALHPVILFAGTVTEAGITAALPVDETQPDKPVTVYDLHKLTAENYLKYYVRRGTVRGAVLRLANVYGPGPESRGADRGVLNGMIRKALKGETLTIYGAGDYVRDYVYAGDVVDAFLSAGEKMESLSGGHYLIGSGEGHTVAEAVHMVARHVEERCGLSVRVVHVDPPSAFSPIEERNFVADTRRFTSCTGWKAGTSLPEGIDLTIDYLSRKITEAI